MAISITGIMNSNMYGIPLAGVDICGFIGNTNPELCARWSTIGGVYPLSRNHNNFGSIPQEPYVEMFQAEYEPGITYQDIIVKGIRRKYLLVMHMYSEMMKISQEGGQLYKPVFYNYPSDLKAWKEPTKNWMIGDQLLVHANTQFLDQNMTYFYFPKGKWCNIETDVCYSSSGENVELRTKAYDIYIHQAENTIVPIQDYNKYM